MMMSRMVAVLKSVMVLLALAPLCLWEQAFAGEAGAGQAELHWLEGAAPATTPGATWGVPWPQGAVDKDQAFALSTDDGKSVPVQTWTIATWPDGSAKWTACAIAPNAGLSERLILAPGEAKAPEKAVTVAEGDDAVTVDTGVIQCRIPRTGANLIESIVRDGRTNLVNGRLVAMTCDQNSLEDSGELDQNVFKSKVESVTVEQAGPMRAVVKIDGKHAALDGSREWLPFSVRLYFYAGGSSVRIMHTFIFDGDEYKDFISGLGVRFDAPMTDALYDRYVRFAGEGDGLWAEAVQGVTGLRRDPGQIVRQMQIDGKKLPPLGEWDKRVTDGLKYVPAWNDVTLSQLNPNGFEIRKRTGKGFGWIRSDAGGRAGGLGYIGGAVNGGVAFALRDFWQRYPSQFDIRHSATDQAEVTMWLWAPDAQPMDMRFYHDVMGMDDHETELDGLKITYEDYEKGWGTPKGIARTTEMFLWVVPTTPRRQKLADMAVASQAPPIPMASPEHILSAKVFGGLWTLPDRSTPVKTRIEDQLDFVFDFYKNQTDQRSWYGFWDFGDVMHTYDDDRHVWRYDVGGCAWDNSELSPDLWLWMSFLRTGRADQFRFAEAMTRHTGEVDVYHLGRFKGLGSRHNVQHWGCSSKQPRVSNAEYRRVYYYLTADERVGDLIHELIDSDMALKTVKITRKVEPDRVDIPYPVNMGFGTDWCSIAAAWLTEWERTGDDQWRQRLLNGMEGIGAMGHGWLAGSAGYDPETGKFLEFHDNVGVSHLSAVFGAVEINAELLQLLDVPSYEKAWVDYCRLYGASREEKEKEAGQYFRGFLAEAHSRLTAFAAMKLDDKALADRAWAEFVGGRGGLGMNWPLELRKLKGPDVLNSGDEIYVSTNSASQWGLAAIQNLKLLGDMMPAEFAPRR